MSVRPLTDSDIRDLSRDALLTLAQAQKPNWHKSSKHPFNLDRRLGADKLRRLLLDPDEHFTTTTTTSAVPMPQGLHQSASTHQEVLITESGPRLNPHSGQKKLIVKVIDARFQKHYNRAYTVSVAAHPSRQGCQPGDWNVESQTVVKALMEEPGAQHILDGPYRLSTPLAEGSEFFEDFLVEKTYRRDLLRVPHHNEILVKVEEAQAVENIRQLNARLTGAKRKLLSESGAKPEAEFTETLEATIDNDGVASDDSGDHSYPLVRARDLKTPPGETPRKKLRKFKNTGDYTAEDTLTSLLRQQICTRYTAQYDTFLEHRGSLKLSNSQIIANWQFGVDICNEYHKKVISGAQQRIDFKHIYGALKCSETWLRDARNYINLVSMYGSPLTAGTAEIRAKLESTEVSAGGRKDLVAYLRSLEHNSKETDRVLAVAGRQS